MDAMINRAGLLTLYSYNFYANKLVLDALEKLTNEVFMQPSSPSHGSVHGMLTHILECEAFFLAQCRREPFDLAAEEVSTLERIRAYWERLEQKQRAYIEALDELEIARETQIQLGKQQLVFPVGDLLIQALVHSVHHRGELSIVLSGLGCPLPTLDILLHFIKRSGQHWP